MKHLGTVQLETERLILRRFRLEDAQAMLRNWAGDSEVTRYLMWPTHSDITVSRSVLAQWVPSYEKPDWYQWAMVPKDLDAPIGSIGAVSQRDDIRMVHMGYCIGRPWWGKGYTSEALCELVRFFFEDVGMNRIEARHDPRNMSSGKVMLKAGMVHEGTGRQADTNNQGLCDAAYYAILAEDYFVRKESGALTSL